MAMQWGSFLEGYQESKDKRESAEAAQRAAQEERDYEEKKWIFQQDYQAALTRDEAMRKERIEKQRRLQDRDWSKEDTRNNKIFELFKADKEYMMKTVEALAKTPGGVPPSLAERMIANKYLSRQQINMMNTAGQAELKGTKLKGTVDGLNATLTSHSKGAIIYFPGGERGFVNMYKPIWNQTIYKDEDINAFAREFIGQVAKSKEKFLRKNDPKATSLRAGKGEEEFSTSVGKAKITASFTTNDPSDLVKSLKAHKLHMNTLLYSLRTNLQLGKNKPNGGIGLNAINDKDFIRDRLESEMYKRNEFIGKTKIPYKDLKTFIRSHQGGDEFIKNYMEPQSGNELLIGRDEPAVSTQTKPQVSAAEPPVESQTNAIASETSQQPSTLPSVKPEAAPSMSNADIISKPYETGDNNVFLPSGLDSSKEGIYHIGFEHKPEHDYGVMKANHIIIGNALTEATGRTDLDSNETENYFMQLNTKDNLVNRERKKAYLTYRISKRFQEFAQNPLDSRMRTQISKDNTFHKHLIELQNEDPNFDARSAFAEAYFRTIARYEVDPSKQGDGSSRDISTGSSMYYKQDGTPLPTYSRAVAIRNKTQDMLNDLDHVVELAQKGAGGVPLVGAASDATVFLQRMTRTIGDFKTLFQQFVKNPNTSREGYETSTDVNRGLMNDFMEKAEGERIRLKGDEGEYSAKEYIYRSRLLSAKIQLAYTLSSALQGDGTGGGRTISDADFKYAMLAIWGTEPEQIIGRLTALRSSTNSKLNRLKADFKYDKLGQAEKVRTFMNEFDKYQRMDMDERWASLLAEGANNEGSVPSATDTKAMYPALEKRLTSNEALLTFGQDTEGRMFSNSKKKRKNQLLKIGNVTSHLLNHTLMPDLVTAYTTAKSGNEDLDANTFVRNFLKVGTPNHKNFSSLRNTVTNSLFSRIEMINNTPVSVPNPDSILRSKDGKLVVSSDKSLKPVSVFDRPSQYYEDKGNTAGPASLYFSILSFAIESLYKSKSIPA